MAKIAFITILSLIIGLNSIPELNPTLGKDLDLTLEGELEFINQQEECEKLWELAGNQQEFEKLSDEDKTKLENCDETYDSYWDVIGQECSWYCGGGQDTLSASSSLSSNKDIDYKAKNAHDLSYKTAWIEGVDGYGIGETIVYHFPPQNPRITKIIIANGYVKTEKSYRENSRVKKFKMYINEKPFAILNLIDSREEQEFSFDPIGEFEREDFDALQAKPWWTMSFEILEVYEGEKYDDTAITEIYFDGIDVH